MQKINVVCVGKIKEEYLRLAIAEYLKRLSRFAKVDIKELPEGKTLKDEAEPILKAAKGFKIALCVEGGKLSSESFAQKIKLLCDKGEEISLIIGSSCGLDKSVKDAADLKLSFSDMTFPHQLMRVILLEQVYRAFMINSGSEYHK
ncbi:MAG: 23S rRNA (pseudouridine(1915)-N(3))-methyltransferase RlmH [Clostridiales bacterium]|nr:23S rRNA (pseudouridine(1915)-N(3))-methyltransferase RlmH [Clostridiales bacterium]